MPRCRSATSARAGRELFRYRDINQLDPATGERAVSRLHLHQPVRVERELQLQRAAGEPADLAAGTGSPRPLNYTWSHSIDTASDGQDYVPNAAQPDDSLEPGRESAARTSTSRHRLVLVLQLGASGARAARACSSGWSLNGIVTLASGMPFNVNYLFEDDYNGSGEFFGRPDLVGDPLAGHGGARPLPEPLGVPGALQPERRGRLRGRPALRQPRPQRLRRARLQQRRPVARQEHEARRAAAAAAPRRRASTSSTTRTSRTRCCRTSPWTSCRTGSTRPRTAASASCRSRRRRTWAAAIRSWAAAVRARSSSRRGFRSSAKIPSAPCDRPFECSSRRCRARIVDEALDGARADRRADRGPSTPGSGSRRSAWRRTRRAAACSSRARWSRRRSLDARRR